jgi:site-specific DNA-methyltransferase (adenine-specific)
MSPRSRILRGDCLAQLRKLPANSVDSMVTDPPAGISFMGKAWDHHKGGRDAWVAWMRDVMVEALRVLKPGAHAFVWAMPRTAHWTALACEDAGFEIREKHYHLFGSGFPKSLDVSKAIDKAAGKKRRVVGLKPDPRYLSPRNSGFGREANGNTLSGHGSDHPAAQLTAPATQAAKQWAGWGTATKPAAEEWLLVRKPLSERNVARNVLRHGTGAINIDASRVAGMVPQVTQGVNSAGHGYKVAKTSQPSQPSQLGRWPANLVLSPEAARELDAQSGTLHGRGNKSRGQSQGAMFGNAVSEYGAKYTRADSGGASRFFKTFTPGAEDAIRAACYAQSADLIPSNHAAGSARKSAQEKPRLGRVGNGRNNGLSAFSAGSSSRTTQAISQNEEPSAAHANAVCSSSMLRNARLASYVERLCAKCVTTTVRAAVKTKRLPRKVLPRGRASTLALKRQILSHALASFAGSQASTAIISTIQGPKKSCGCASTVTGIITTLERSEQSFASDLSASKFPAIPGNDLFHGARFAYIPKPSRRERNAGCEGLPKREVNAKARNKGNLIGSKWIIDPRHPKGGYEAAQTEPRGNAHPTVKPLKLMRYLITMITPPGGCVLDPFAGSGSTLVAAKAAGFRFVGIEREREYVAICRARVRAARPDASASARASA